MACELCGDGIDYKRTTCSDCLARRVHEKRKELHKIEEACKPLRDTIRAQIEKDKAVMKKNMMMGLQEAKLNALKEVLARERQALEAEQQEAERLRNKIKAKQAALEQTRKLRMLQPQPPPLATADMQKLYEQRASELARLRRAFISELLYFFPINPSPTSEKHSIIINIILPNDGNYSGYPPETLSAALGYVAHMVYLVSSYLGVVLPFPIDFAGARSMIRTTDDPPRRFPLYGSRVSDMEVGTRLINLDIVHLCHSQGVYLKRIMYGRTLPNLMELLRVDTLGWPGPREWSRTKQRPLPLLRVQSAPQMPAHIKDPTKARLLKKSSSGAKIRVSAEDDDFIVVENTSIPTPSQAEELAHFERALFIDTS